MNNYLKSKQEKSAPEYSESQDSRKQPEIRRDTPPSHEVHFLHIITDLRSEIAKGWDGRTSTRSAKQIAKNRSAYSQQKRKI